MKPDPLWDTAITLARRLAPAVVFDVGAHRGLTCAMFLEAFPAAEVHAFEPQPAMFAEIVRRRAGQVRLRPVQAALGDQVGRTGLHVGASTATSSRFPRNAGGRRYFRADYVMNDHIEVALDTLDAYCERNAVAHIHLLKMDTQGGERDILRGATRLLSQQRIDVIVTEFFAVPHYEDAPLLDGIWTELRSHDYSLFDLFCGPRGSNGQLRYGDAIFVSAAFRAAHLDSAAPEP